MTNNIFDLGASTRTVALLQQPPSNEPPAYTPALTSDSISRNIVVSQQSSPLNAYAYFDSVPLPVGISGNLYWDPAAPGKGLPMASNAPDTNPVIGNPQFVSPASGNDALGSGSAAGLVGFVAIDQSKMGLLLQPA